MHEMITEIFKDAGATEKDLAMIETLAVNAALEARQVVLELSSHPNMPERFVLPLRVLLCRVIHADMEKAFTQYRTEAAKPKLILPGLPGSVRVPGT